MAHNRTQLREWSTEPVSPASRPPLDWLRTWADLLDSRFRVPGTGIRFGIDPLLSLLPGVGELASPVFAVALLLQGVRQRVPKVVLVRMVLNALVDAAIGSIPFAGTVGDIFWRANTRNLTLLERHAVSGQPPTRTDYIFVGGLLAMFLMAMLFIIAVTIWLWRGLVAGA
jgi:hypothetical protein